MGGLPAGACLRDEHDYAPWEKRVDALMMLLSARERRFLTVDELRRNIEDLGAQAYDALGYYERWMHAIAQTLLQRGVLSIEEIAGALANAPRAPLAAGAASQAEASAVPAPDTGMCEAVSAAGAGAAAVRFAVGDRVRVRAGDPPGHVRTPWYCRGRTGSVERICGAFANPEELAYARPGLPPRTLYRVRFECTTLSPDYAGHPGDVVEIEIYEHWLEAS
jgi:nitrile hydratase